MMNDLVIDTNVWIYAMDKGSSFYSTAQSIILNPDYNLFITSKSISEFFAVTSKIRIPYTSSLDFYNELKKNAHILFPSEQSLDIFKNLIQKYHPNGNQVFDIEIVSIMLAHAIKNIATFNVSR